MTKETNILEGILKRFDEIPHAEGVNEQRFLACGQCGDKKMVCRKHTKHFILTAIKEVLDDVRLKEGGKLKGSNKHIVCFDGHHYFDLISQINKELTKE